MDSNWASTCENGEVNGQRRSHHVVKLHSVFYSDSLGQSSALYTLLHLCFCQIVDVLSGKYALENRKLKTF